MEFFNKLGTKLKKYQQIIWLLILFQTLAGMLGSLYFSSFGDPVFNLRYGNLFPDGSGFPPCDLCWYARILLYPMVLITAIGIIKKDKKFTDYIIVPSIMGILLTGYHYTLQKFPIVTIFKCTEINPCSALDVNYFGFITIPLLAFIAFVFLTLLCVANWLINKEK